MRQSSQRGAWRRRFSVPAVLLCLVLPSLVLAACGDKDKRDNSSTSPSIDTPATTGGQAITIAGVRGALFGPAGGNGIVLGVAGEPELWAAVAEDLARNGYRVLLYAAADANAAEVGRAATDALERSGTSKIAHIAHGAATAPVLQAATGRSVAVVALNPSGPPDPVPLVASLAAPLLSVAALGDTGSSALARRMDEAAPEPHTLALYPARVSGPEIFRAAETSEIRTAIVDFLREAFTTLTA